MQDMVRYPGSATTDSNVEAGSPLSVPSQPQAAPAPDSSPPGPAAAAGMPPSNPGQYAAPPSVIPQSPPAPADVPPVMPVPVLPTPNSDVVPSVAPVSEAPSVSGKTEFQFSKLYNTFTARPCSALYSTTGRLFHCFSTGSVITVVNHHQHRRTFSRQIELR
eukprot:GHVQ01022893.1.p1 GENE.GHVQ01022893.1~~GHVQ01022893.1.p1  ORF type:complete len:162 (-),score=8.55 GHVQ01022893.1:1118-1603(-)